MEVLPRKPLSPWERGWGEGSEAPGRLIQRSHPELLQTLHRCLSSYLSRVRGCSSPFSAAVAAPAPLSRGRGAGGEGSGVGLTSRERRAQLLRPRLARLRSALSPTPLPRERGSMRGARGRMAVQRLTVPRRANPLPLPVKQPAGLFTRRLSLLPAQPPRVSSRTAASLRAPPVSLCEAKRVQMRAHSNANSRASFSAIARVTSLGSTA
jgi:hypothetical protein